MMSNFGYTEREARVAIHLEEAEKLLDELMVEIDPRPALGRIVWTETHTHEQFSALRRRLAMLVIRRDYPDGWGHMPLEEEG